MPVTNVFSPGLGRFEWGGSNFAESAEDISFNMEGDGQPILRTSGPRSHLLQPIFVAGWVDDELYC